MPRFNAQSVGSDIAQAFSAQIKGKTGGWVGGLTVLTPQFWSPGGHWVASVPNLPRPSSSTPRDWSFSPRGVRTSGFGERLELRRRFEETATAIRSITPDAPLRSLLLDTSSMANVRRAAAEVNGWPETVDLLADGRSPRIVVVGSGAHGMVKTFRWDDPHYLKEDEYEPGTQYAESKVLNQLLGPALVRKSSGRVKAYTCSPGPVQAYPRGAEAGLWASAPPGVHISSGLKVAPEDALEDRMWAATEDWVGERFRF
ncbi:hypothetical protein IAU60_001915 [Kwoniella sp. DSM 27419]